MGNLNIEMIETIARGLKDKLKEVFLVERT